MAVVEWENAKEREIGFRGEYAIRPTRPSSANSDNISYGMVTTRNNGITNHVNLTLDRSGGFLPLLSPPLIS